MWFGLSLVALLFLSVRRTSEKRIATNISSSALAWLQQAMALPFIVVTLFFAKFYWPNELPMSFWLNMLVYVICGAIDLFCYFKSLSIADVSFVAPLLTLTSVAIIIGSYFILGQVPSLSGVFGASLVVAGAYIINRAKRKDTSNAENNKRALLLILVMVTLRGLFANIEVNMLRISNPTTFNFYSSVLTVPLVVLVTSVVVRSRKEQFAGYWTKVGHGIREHFWPLLFVGLTYTINLLATYQAKLLSPNAGYVASVKSASILPVVFIGYFFFKEKVVRTQWYGIVLILIGLAFLAMN